MLVKQIEPGQGLRRYVRRMIFGCKVCGARLQCPDDAEQWGWLKSNEAQGFLAEHFKHGTATTAGWHFEFQEIDD